MAAQDYDLGHRGKIGFHEFLRMFRRHLLDLQVGPPHPRTSCPVLPHALLVCFFDNRWWLGVPFTLQLPIIPVLYCCRWHSSRVSCMTSSVWGRL